MGWLSKAWNAVTGTIKAIVSNPVTAIAAIGLSIYAPALGLRMLGSMMVSNVLNAVTAKDPKTSSTDGGSTLQQGTNQVMPVDPSRKIPVIYGSAWVSGIITDAKISSDNQTMWYVIAVCEAPDSGEATVTFGDMYWDEQKITFSGSEYGRVIKVTNKAGQEDTKIDGNLWIYPYNGSSSPLTLNGLSSSVSAITRLQDTAIPAVARWSNTDAMTGTIFYVVKCVYSTDDNMTGLRGLKARISVNQTGVTGGYRPGAAMIDYLTNDRYGAGLDPERVYAQSFAELDSYSDVLINFSQFGGGTASQPRYRINGILDTTQPVMSNLLDLADCCDSYIQFNEARGQWAVIANKSVLQYPNIKTYNELFVLDDTNIIGGVNIIPLDLNSTPNEVEVGFNSDAALGAMAYTYASTPENLKSVNEPLNKLTLNYKFVNDSVRAQYLSNRKLEQCRADYIVQLTADYSAIQIDAGDVVALTYKPYGNNLNGWGDNKLFRVTQVTENRADNGDLTVGLHLMEYAEAVYDDRNITEFSPPSGGVVLDPRLLAKPGTPTFPDATVLPSGNPPTFVVQAEVPRSGVTVAMEFWYGPTQEITNNNYILYNTEYNSGGNQYAISAAGAEVYERETVSGLPEGTWYWRVRAIGTSRKSDFSDAALINWAPAAVDGTKSNGTADLPDMVLVPFENQRQEWPDNTRGIMPAGGTSLIVANKPGAVHVNFSASVYSDTNATMNCLEVWKSVASEVFSKKVFALRHSFSHENEVNVKNRLVGVGTNLDLYSDDGGYTWATWSNTLSPATMSSVIPIMKTQLSGGVYHDLYSTNTYGKYQYKDGSTTEFANCGDRYDGQWTDLGVFPIKFQYVVLEYRANKSTVNMYTSVNDAAITPKTGGKTFTTSGQDGVRPVQKIIVADNGGIFCSVNYPNYADGAFYREISNTLQNLYSVYGNFPDTNTNYTAIAVGAFGTVLKCDRSKYYDDGHYSGYPSDVTWNSKDTKNTDGEELTANLLCVAGDDGDNTATDKWVAVGTKGTIIYSNDNGETWNPTTAYFAADGAEITSRLNGVRYGGGKWVIVGDNGLILTSTDMINWTQIGFSYLTTNGWDTRHFYTIDHDPTFNTFNIGGDNIILTSSSTGTLNFAKTYVGSPDETYDLTRLWYRGSHANVRVTGNAVASSNQLLNGQTVSSTIIDTDYKKGDELGYYLVVGNIKGVAGQQTKVGGAVITAVEYKK